MRYAMRPDTKPSVITQLKVSNYCSLILFQRHSQRDNIESAEFHPIESARAFVIRFPLILCD